MAATTHATVRAALKAITGYHAHIYFDRKTRRNAAELRAALGERFDVVLGRWREDPVGPHPQAMYQVAFGTELLAEFLPWLMLNRRGLSILVHPLTDNDLADHTDFPLWLGEKLDLNIELINRISARRS